MSSALVRGSQPSLRWGLGTYSAENFSAEATKCLADLLESIRCWVSGGRSATVRHKNLQKSRAV